MKRILIMIVLVLMTVNIVSAAPERLTTSCNTDEIRAELTDNLGYNCFDIVCTAFVGDTIVKVSDGTIPASEGTELRGYASYLTKSETDLRVISGYCDTPTFEERFCSIREDWDLVLGIVRHYSEADDATGEAEHDWAPVLGEIPRSIGEFENESVVLYDGGRDSFLCSDKLPPQLLFDERFDMRTGEREITLTFSDDEMNYSEMNRTEAGWTRTPKIALLMDRDGEAAVDQTKLDRRCEYAITTSEATPADWQGQACTGFQDTIEIPASAFTRTDGLYLHMRAWDDQGNDAIEAYKLTDYYRAYGVDENGDPEGYCPRENECLAWPDGDRGLIGINQYLASGQENDLPVCIPRGTAVNNVYCTDNGLITRSQALLSYGLDVLGSSSGVVYCGRAPEVARSSIEDGEQCERGKTSYESSCTLSCVLSYDIDTVGEPWQRSAALFASNNFLENTINGPPALYEGLDPNGFTIDSCSPSGTTGYTCTTSLLRGVGESTLEQDVRIVYDNRTGLASISQTIDTLGIPNMDVIDGSLGDSLVVLTTALNRYLSDISVNSYDTPQYSPEELRETLDISAYRTGTNKRIVGITTDIPLFEHRAEQGGDTTPKSMRVVAVLYEGFSSTERDYLDQAKDAISSVGSTHVRQNIIENLRGTESYVILIAVENDDYEDHAHELIEQLVVRPRI